MDNGKIEELIIKALLGEELPEEEQQLLDEWLKESAGNRAFFLRVGAQQYLAKAIEDENQELMNSSWKNLRTKTIGKKEHRIRRWAFRVAAMLALPVICGGIIWYMLNQVEKTEIVPQETIDLTDGNYRALVTLSNGQQITFSGDTVISAGDELGTLRNHKDTLSFVCKNSSGSHSHSRRIIQIPRGAEYIVRLEDGSVVYLNAESELQVAGNFGDTKREVWLKGEAYFKVQHDKDRLFTVHTDNVAISVLGTEFGVRAYAGEKMTQTTLVAGAVKVQSGTTVKTIVPGEQACVEEEGNVKIQKVDVQEFVSWKDGRLVFVNARLEDILKDLQRLYDFEVAYTLPEQKELRFTIDINKYGKVVEIFDLIQDIRKVKFEINGRNVVLK